MEKDGIESNEEMDQSNSFEDDEPIENLTKASKLLKSIYEGRLAVIFFDYDQISKEKKNQEKDRIEEIDFKINKLRKYCARIKAYKTSPLCLAGPIQTGGLLKTSSYNKANLIWKLIPFDQILNLIPKLKKYQRFNHFPTLWQLGRKDKLYINYKKLKKITTPTHQI